jgi:hypothetical protein
MAKVIYMEEHDIDTMLSELKTQMLNQKMFGKIDIKKQITADQRVCGLYFTPTAWAKITSLVARFSTEVQWHGLVRRISQCAFEVYDIIVPPHEVTGSTVTSDQTKYNEWLNGLDDDTFKALRFHGHSHVEMHPSPSGVDDKYRQDVITQLPKPRNGSDEFYIFLIINKKHEWTAEIYDMTYNALYNSHEIDMDVLFEDETYLGTFMAEAKKVAVTRTYSYNGYSGGGAKHGQYTGYTPVTPTYSTPAGKGASSKAEKAEKKKSEKKKSYDLSKYYDDLYSKYDSYDDEDDPTDPFYAKEYYR